MDQTYPARTSLNVEQHRSGTSVWNRADWNGVHSRHVATRMLVGVAGGTLALQGWRLGGWQGRLLAGVGGALAWWAATTAGRWPSPGETFGAFTRRAPWRSGDAMVTEASDESFPASDAPSWTPTVGTGLRRTAGRA